MTKHNKEIFVLFLSQLVNLMLFYLSSRILNLNLKNKIISVVADRVRDNRSSVQREWWHLWGCDSLVKFVCNIEKKSKAGLIWRQKRRKVERDNGTVGQARTDILIEERTTGVRVRGKKLSCLLVRSREFSASYDRNITGDAVGG